MAIYIHEPSVVDDDYGEKVLDLDMAKAHLGVLADDEDDLIAFLRNAAVDLVEKRAEVYLAPRDGVTIVSSIDFGGSVSLGWRPIRALISMTCSDGGDPIACDVSDYRVVRDTVRPRLGKSWPIMSGEVELVVDLGPPDNVQPFPNLVLAVQRMLAFLFDNRDDAKIGGMEAAYPGGVMALIQQEATYRL